MYLFKLHVGWFSLYTVILILLLMAEMYAIGARRQWSLTENTCAVVERAHWVGIPVLLLLLWLLVHFSIRLIPIMLGKPPMHWV